MKIKLLSIFIVSFLSVNTYAQAFPYSENQRKYTLWFLEGIGVKSTEIEKFKQTGDIDALHLLELILKKAKTKEGIGIIYDFDKNLTTLSTSKTIDNSKKSKNNKTKEVTDALSNIMGTTNANGNASRGQGNDNVAGYKGSPDEAPYASSYYGSGGSGTSGKGWGLKGRSIESEGKVLQDCNESGTIVVQIEVDQNGNVVKATSGVRGSTSREACLLEAARKTAFKHKWNADSKAPARQVGFIVINFKLGE